MKLWFDPIDEAPIGYIWCKAPFVFKAYLLGNWDIISTVNLKCDNKSIIECNTIRILKWLEEQGKVNSIWNNVRFKFIIRSMDEEQRAIIEEILNRNKWELIEKDV